MKNFLPITRFNKGFSLIELLVAVTFLAIIGTVGAIGFSNYNEVQQVTQAATNIELMISQARSNAQSVVKTTTDEDGALQTCGGAQLVSYVISITPPTLSLIMVCQPPPPGSVINYPIRNINLSSDFMLISSCSNISFDSLTAEVDFTPGSVSSCDITVHKNTQKTIKIDNNGNVEII